MLKKASEGRSPLLCAAGRGVCASHSVPGAVGAVVIKENHIFFS